MHLSLSLVQYLHYMTSYMPIIDSDALLGTKTNPVRHCAKERKRGFRRSHKNLLSIKYALNLYMQELGFSDPDIDLR